MPCYNSLVDLKLDDDVISALLLNNFGSPDGTKLGVHHATPGFEEPTGVKQSDLLDMIRELVAKRGNVKAAYEYFSQLKAVKQHLATKDPLERALFQTHTFYYLNLYLSSNPLEIGKTSRYSHFTGKCELGVFATRKIKAGTRLTPFLAGDVAPFTSSDSEKDTAADSDLVWEKDGGEEDDDKEGQKAESSAMGAGRKPRRKAPVQQAAKDFSVVYSTKNKREEFFLGTARFVNHDCFPNARLIRSVNHTVSMEVFRDIPEGGEVTLHYRDEYFGPDNEMCLCLTCENAGKGWYKDRSKPSSSSTDLVNSPASSDVSFATATTSSITATTSKLCISTSGAPLSSSSHRSLNNDHDSLPGTPGSSSSVDAPFEAAPIPSQGRVLRGKAISGGEVVPGAERILWGEEGEEEKREKGCRRCRAGVEMRFVNETWVEREGGCMRCKRHYLIFKLSHPQRPDIDKTLPPYFPPSRSFPPKLLAPQPQPLQPASNHIPGTDAALKDEYRLDKQAFDRKHPGVSEGWRKEVKINKARKKQRKLEEEGRSYKMVVFTREGDPFECLKARICSILMVRSNDPKMDIVKLDGFAQLFAHKLGDASPWASGLPVGREIYKVSKGSMEVRGSWAPIEFATEAVKKAGLWPLLRRFLAPNVDFLWPPPISPDSLLDVQPKPHVHAPELFHPLHDPVCLDVLHQALLGPNSYEQQYPVPEGAIKKRGALPTKKARQPLNWNVENASVPRHVRYGDEQELLHYEISVTHGGVNVVVGRMGQYHWINLSAALELVPINQNEKNRVYSNYKTTVYSTPADTHPVPRWVGVWVSRPDAIKIFTHFGLMFLLETLTLPLKELEALAAAASDEESELEQPSPAKSKSKSSPLRPSPSKNPLPLSSPRLPFDIAAEPVQMEEVHDEADDEMEEDDGDLDAVMKNLNALEPEKAVEPPELDMLRAADRLLEDEDFGDEEMEEDDVLSVLFADEPPKMEDDQGPASPLDLPEASPPPPAAPPPARSHFAMDVVEISSDEIDDEDDDDDVVIIESESDDDVQLVENKGKGKAVDRRPPSPSRPNHPYFNPRPPPQPKASISSFFNRRPNSSAGPSNAFAFINKPQSSSSPIGDRPRLQPSHSSSASSGPSKRPHSHSSSPRESPATTSSSASSEAARPGGQQNPYTLDRTPTPEADSSDDSDVRIVPQSRLKKKARPQSPPRQPAPGPASGPSSSKVSRSPSKVPMESARSSPADVIDLTSD